MTAKNALGFTIPDAKPASQLNPRTSLDISSIHTRLRPNRLSLCPPHVAYAILQQLHRYIVGKPIQLHFDPALSKIRAKDAYRKSLAGAFAMLLIVPEQVRLGLVRDLMSFVAQEKSMDGLEGLFLSVLNGIALDRNQDLFGQAAGLWKQVGPAGYRDGGFQTSIVFDMSGLSFLDGTDVGSISGHLANGLGRGNPLAGILDQGEFGAASQGSNLDPLGDGILGSGLPGANGSAGGWSNAGAGFLAKVLGTDAAPVINDLRDVATIFGGSLGGLKAGALVGAVAGPEGALIGAAVGMFVGFISATLDVLANKDNGQIEKLNQELDQVTQGLEEALAGLKEAIKKLDEQQPQQGQQQGQQQEGEQQEGQQQEGQQQQGKQEEGQDQQEQPEDKKPGDDGKGSGLPVSDFEVGFGGGGPNDIQVGIDPRMERLLAEANLGDNDPSGRLDNLGGPKPVPIGSGKTGVGAELGFTGGGPNDILVGQDSRIDRLLAGVNLGDNDPGGRLDNLGGPKPIPKGPARSGPGIGSMQQVQIRTGGHTLALAVAGTHTVKIVRVLTSVGVTSRTAV